MRNEDIAHYIYWYIRPIAKISCHRPPHADGRVRQRARYSSGVVASVARKPAEQGLPNTQTDDNGDDESKLEGPVIATTHELAYIGTDGSTMTYMRASMIAK